MRVELGLPLRVGGIGSEKFSEGWKNLMHTVKMGHHMKRDNLTRSLILLFN